MAKDKESKVSIRNVYFSRCTHQMRFTMFHLQHLVLANLGRVAWQLITVPLK